MVKKKLLSVTLVAVTVCSMIFTGCGNSAENTGNDTGKTDTDVQAGNTAEDVADVADDVEKPEKITIMVDGTFQATLADGQEEWVNKWEELTGIELEEQFRTEEKSQYGCGRRRRQYAGRTSVRIGTWRRWRMYDFPQETVAG